VPTAGTKDRVVALIGYRGVGKTAVARLLASRLGWACIDIDREIERVEGRSIREIFEIDGQQKFRQIELEFVARALGRVDAVVSFGGGAVLAPENRRILRESSICFWLKASPDELHRRLRSDPHSAAQRPPLTDQSPLEEIRSVLAAREPHYAEVADHVVDTTGRTVEAVADQILAILAARRGPRETPT
jgi:shikimate kinase